MSWIDFQKSQPPFKPKRMLVIKLWDKVIPIAHTGPYDEACMPVRTVWIPGIDPKSIRDKYARETHYRLMLLLHASMADTFRLEKRGRVLTYQANLDQDVFETVNS